VPEAAGGPEGAGKSGPREPTTQIVSLKSTSDDISKNGDSNWPASTERADEGGKRKPFAQSELSTYRGFKLERNRLCILQALKEVAELVW
jgi:hypothetical protein